MKQIVLHLIMVMMKDATDAASNVMFMSSSLKKYSTTLVVITRTENRGENSYKHDENNDFSPHSSDNKQLQISRRTKSCADCLHRQNKPTNPTLQSFFGVPHINCPNHYYYLIFNCDICFIISTVERY